MSRPSDDSALTQTLVIHFRVDAAPRGLPVRLRAAASTDAASSQQTDDLTQPASTYPPSNGRLESQYGAPKQFWRAHQMIRCTVRSAPAFGAPSFTSKRCSVRCRQAWSGTDAQLAGR